MIPAEEQKSDSVASHSCTDGNSIEQIFQEITVYPTSRIKAEEHCKIYPAAIPFDYRMGFQAGVEWLKREVLNRINTVQVSDTTEAK